jgi:hypothetical protein
MPNRRPRDLWETGSSQWCRPARAMVTVVLCAAKHTYLPSRTSGGGAYFGQNIVIETNHRKHASLFK